MPVTAKLSSAFYHKLGDAATNELVDWLNATDADYRSQLRELNELNFSRFDAKVEQRFAQADAALERRFAQSESRMLRWMFTFWTGTIVGIAALMYAMVHGALK